MTRRNRVDPFAADQRACDLDWRRAQTPHIDSIRADPAARLANVAAHRHQHAHMPRALVHQSAIAYPGTVATVPV